MNLKTIIPLLLCCFAALRPEALFADKMTDYSAASSVLATDIVWATIDPGGTPLDRKVTFAVIDTLLSATTKTLTNKSISLGSNTLTFTSAQLITACSNETGTGALVFGTSPDFTTGITIGGVAVPTISSTNTLTNKTISLTSNTLTATSAQLITAISDESGTGALVFANTPTLVTPNIGDATATSLTTTGSVLLQGGTSALGFEGGSGVGGAVTQATSKSTSVTLNKSCGEIVMNNAVLNAGSEVGFTVSNTFVDPYDVVIVNISSVATLNSYTVCVDAVASDSFHITISNVSGSNLSEAIVLHFAVIQAAAD